MEKQNKRKLTNDHSVIEKNKKHSKTGYDMNGLNDAQSVTSPDEDHQTHSDCVNMSQPGLDETNIFQLQVNELLKEVTFNPSTNSLVENFVYKLKCLLTKPSEGLPEELSYVKSFKSTCKIPVLMRPKKTKGQFVFCSPKSVEIVGSFKMDTCIGPKPEIDVTIVMPKRCFQGKDHLNHRYIRKRALYLSHIADRIQGQEFVDSLHYRHHLGNPFHPVIVVKPSDNRPFVVVIHAVPEHGAIDASRLRYNRNNIRPSWYYQNNETDSHLHPTPVYNATILSDVQQLENNKFISETLGQCRSIKEGLSLLKLWLQQRQLNKGYGCFCGFTMTALVCFLVVRRKIVRMMNSKQIFINVLRYLASSDWAKNPITLSNPGKESKMVAPQDMSDSYDVVFTNQTSHLNICYTLDYYTYLRVKHEAGLSLEAIKNSIHSFEELFLTPMSFLSKFDHIFTIHSVDWSLVISQLGLDNKLLDFGYKLPHFVIRSILDILTKSMGRRVRLMQCKLLTEDEWSVLRKARCSRTELMFGLLLDPDHCNNVLEKGPYADQPEAKAFRDFWGELSNMRRFQDGSICEAVVWDGDNTAQRRLVVKQILTYVLSRHVGIKEDSVSYHGGALDFVISSGLKSTGEEHYDKFLSSFDSLAKFIRSLDLPLKVTSVQGSSASFSHTEVTPPLPPGSQSFSKLINDHRIPVNFTSGPSWFPSQTVVCTLEDSSQWPNDHDAIQRMKTAFYIELAKQITSLGIVQVFSDSVYLVKDSFVFRLIISSQRELSCLRKATTAQGLVKVNDSPEYRQLYFDTVTLPILRSSFNSLQSRMNTFANSTRLSKRWVHSHLLSNHIDDLIVELIMSYLYINPSPYDITRSAEVGFYRFLQFLSSCDWNLSPLIVNFNNHWSVDDMKAIEDKFNRNRDDYPLMYIVTPQGNPDSSCTCPSATVLTRLSALAKISLDILNANLLDNFKCFDFRVLFQPSYEDFDVVIYLLPDRLPRRHEAIGGKISGEPMEFTDLSPFPVVDFDPVILFLRDLKEEYGNEMMFFHDENGGDVITAVWTPLFRKKLEGSKSEDWDLLEELIEKIKTIGRGLVHNVQSKIDELTA